MTPPCSLDLLILLIMSMTSYKTKGVVLTRGACNKSRQAEKNTLRDRKYISQKRKHSAETAKGTFLCQKAVQPKEGLADEEHNCGNT